ncbi:16S rRNA (guanine(966)-N(2))-methyltransferase RsmD [Thermodesulfobacteriota bacterium]
MKITGGSSRGRVLTSLKGMSIRPTSSNVREAVFNLLGQDIAGLKVLDLFAGTGILGIEALSRGALRALFIDNSPQSIKIIRKNLALCGFENSGFVLKRDLIKGLLLEHLMVEKRFDLVFIDPPYGKDIIPPILKELSLGEALASPSIVVTESLKKDRLPVSSGKLHLFETRVYGETKIDLYSSEEI